MNLLTISFTYETSNRLETIGVKLESYDFIVNIKGKTLNFKRRLISKNYMSDRFQKIKLIRVDGEISKIDNLVFVKLNFERQLLIIVVASLTALVYFTIIYSFKTKIFLFILSFSTIWTLLSFFRILFCIRRALD